MAKTPKKLVDIHCHILPSVDDGPKHITKSLDILEKAQKAGFTDLILTPHFIPKSRYSYTHKTTSALLDILKQGIKERGLELNLYLGNENYLTPNLPALLKSKTISSLANSHYILLELPLTTEDFSAKDTIFHLQTEGYTPIIAHPERYLYFQSDPTKIDAYLSQGCLLQGDYLSLFGKYGRSAKKTLTTLLKNHKIHFLASDIHKPTDNYNLEKAYKKVTHLTSEKEALNLFSQNPSKILNDQPL